MKDLAKDNMFIFILVFVFLTTTGFAKDKYHNFLVLLVFAVIFLAIFYNAYIITHL